jgi:hypothetical protein
MAGASACIPVLLHCVGGRCVGDCPERRHSGIVGNECADAIAKPSALYGGGHDVHFQPPAPDGNAYTHLYWLVT